MKFQIQREEFLNPLQQIIGAVEKRQTMPALSNVLIRAEKDSLTLVATDLEIELLARKSIVIDQPGDITVPARKLLDICKALATEAEITFSLDKEKAIIKSGRSRFSLATLPAGDFPALDTIETQFSFDIAQKTLRELIDKTAFAMAQQDVRYYLNGLLLEVSPQKLRTVATDGHRLAFCEKECEHSINDLKQVILPRKGVLELVRLLHDSDATVKLSLANNHLQAELENTRFTSKLIDGRFPDYSRVMPETSSDLLTADRDLLKQALVRASILSNEKYRGIRLILNKNLLKLEAQNPDQEEADVELEVEYSGPDIEIGFNVNYMLDALNASSSPTVQTSLRDSNSSCLLTFPDNADCKYVIMPMRL
jgi:DNA polymerase-3 subunit beta